MPVRLPAGFGQDDAANSDGGGSTEAQTDEASGGQLNGADSGVHDSESCEDAAANGAARHDFEGESAEVVDEQPAVQQENDVKDLDKLGGELEIGDEQRHHLQEGEGEGHGEEEDVEGEEKEGWEDEENT